MEDKRLTRIEDKLDKLAEMLAAQAVLNGRVMEDRVRIEKLEHDMEDARYHIRLIKLLGALVVACLTAYKTLKG